MRRECRAVVAQTFLFVKGFAVSCQNKALSPLRSSTTHKQECLCHVAQTFLVVVAQLSVLILTCFTLLLFGCHGSGKGGCFKGGQRGSCGESRFCAGGHRQPNKRSQSRTRAQSQVQAPVLALNAAPARKAASPPAPVLPYIPARCREHCVPGARTLT